MHLIFAKLFDRATENFDVDTLELHFSSANGAGLFYQTPPLLPYLDAHYSTRSTTNAIRLPR